MSEQQYRETCPGCGARMRPGADACELCGYAGEQSDVETGVEIQARAARSAESASSAQVVPAANAGDGSGTVPGTLQGVFCNDCGWKNPIGARFCARCGAKLQQLTAGAPQGTAPASRPSPASSGPSAPASGASAAGEQKADFRQMSVVMTAGAILLVLALYAITVFSKQNFATATPEPAPQETAADRVGAGEALVPPALEAQVAAIRASADSLSGAVRAARLAEIVNLYLTNGLVQQAAEAQAVVADEIGTAVAWADAGNLSYRAMQAAEGQAKIALATGAIDAYTRSLDLDPDNPDVRTDMATAYLATNNPMEGVRQIRQVLDANPDHVQANFNYGVMLSMIGRTDQSIVQFERVRSLAPPGSETYQQAELALRELQAE